MNTYKHQHRKLWLVGLMLLLWTSLASAFSVELKAAAEAVYNGTASKQQKAMVLMNYQKLNLMGLGGDGRGGVSDAVYQANQKLFAEFNDTVSRDTLAYMGMDGTLPDIKDRYKAGTDTDINVLFKKDRKLQVKDLQEMREYYNVAYRKQLEDAFDMRIDEKVNWAAANETDFMPDTQHIDQQEFARAAKFVNKEGGWMYENPKAVEVEINKGKPGYKIDLEGANAYSQEMLENIEKKSTKMAKHQAKLGELMNERNFSTDDMVKQKVQIEINEVKAQIQLDQSQMAKYMDRLDDLNLTIRKKNGLPALPEPKGMEALASDISKNRGPTTATKAMELAAKKELIQQNSLKNLSKTYAEMATLSADPKLRNSYLRDAAQMSQKYLPPDGQKQLIQDVTAIYGKDAPVVKELTLEVKKAKAQAQMESLAPAMKFVAVAGFANDAFDIYDSYKEGGLNKVAQDQLVNAGTGKIMEAVTSRFMAAVPSAGPVLAVAGSGMASYQLTRNVMERVTIGGKTLDEHTQEGIDNALYVSGADKQTRDANLTKMLTRLLANDKYSLPEGMTIQQAQQQVLANADKGGPLFAFLNGAPKPVEKVEKKLTLDDISLDRIEGTTPEEIERDAKISQDLITLIKGGKYALPDGMTMAQARKQALLNDRERKDKFSFLINKDKRRQEQMAALEKWKNEVNPALPYQFISFRNQTFAMTKFGLQLTATAVWSVEEPTCPPGGMALYRDGDLVEFLPVNRDSGRFKLNYEKDPMDPKKWLYTVTVTLQDQFKGLDDRLRVPSSYFYHLVWHQFDDQGQPKEAMGRTELKVTYAVFPNPAGGLAKILLCKEDGKSLNEDEASQALQAHLAAHYDALAVDPEPSRSMPDVEVYRIELPADLYSSYQAQSDGGFRIEFWSQGRPLGFRSFSQDGKLTGQEFMKRGLLYNSRSFQLDGRTRQVVSETWYDDQGRLHGPKRITANGQVGTDQFYKHGQKHGRQVSLNPVDDKILTIETYQDGKKHGLFERYHGGYLDKPTGVIELKTTYLDGIEAGPHEEYYENGTKKLYAEYVVQDGKSVKHGLYQSWNDQGNFLVDEQYDMGQYHGRCRYFSKAGDLQRESNFDKGIKYGIEELYYESKNLKSRTPYKEGKRYGVAEFYNYNGTEDYFELYLDDQRKGMVKQWWSHPDGTTGNQVNRLILENTYDSEGFLQSSVTHNYSTVDGHFMSRVETAYTRSDVVPAKPAYEVVRGKSLLSQDPDRKVVKHGKEVWTEGSQRIIELSWSKGVPDGQISTWYNNGNKKGIGHYQNGLQHGEQTGWDEEGNLVYSAHYQSGLLTGEQLTLGAKPGYPDKLIFTTKHFEIRDGQSVETDTVTTQGVKKISGKYVKHGAHVIVVQGKTVFSGAYNEGIPNGDFLEVRDDGSIEKKYLIQGKLNGLYELKNAQGQRLKMIRYQNDLVVEGEQWDLNGSQGVCQITRNKIVDNKPVEVSFEAYDCYLKDGKVVYHGIKKGRYQGQPTYQDTYLDGKKHGPFVLYANGKVKKQGTYANEALDGDYQEYDDQARLIREATYDHGQVLLDRTLSYRNNAVYSTVQPFVVVDGQSYVQGKIVSKKDELVISVDEYDHSKRHGTHAQWTEDGQPIFSRQYDQGVPHGTHEEWMEDGRLKSRIEYEHGQRVSELNNYETDGVLKGSLSNWILVDGKPVLHGWQKRFVNEKPVSEEYYDHAEKDGTWSKWSDTGVLLQQESYQAGQLHGDYLRFTDQGKPREAVVYERGKKLKEVSYDPATGNVFIVRAYDADENVLKEGSYYYDGGKVSKTISSYVVIDGKSVYHGSVQRFVDNQLQSEDMYDRGIKTSSTTCTVQEGKRYMTWTSYMPEENEPLCRGMVKHYCDGQLFSEQTYEKNQLIQEIHYSIQDGKACKDVTPYVRFDGKSLRHGTGQFYREGVCINESYYEKGDLVKFISYGQRDGKPLKTIYPYIQADGKSMIHGIVKRYLDDKLIEEIQYQNDKEVK